MRKVEQKRVNYIGELLIKLNSANKESEKLINRFRDLILTATELHQGLSEIYEAVINKQKEFLSILETRELTGLSPVKKNNK